MTEQGTENPQHDWEVNVERDRILLEASLEGIILHDHGLILDINPAVVNITGYTPQQLIGRQVIELLAEECRSLMDGRVSDGASLRTETLGLHKDGTVYFMEMNQREKIVGGLSISIINFRDITEWKEMELQLENTFLENNALHMQLEDTKFAMDQHSVVAITDQQGVITYANDKFCEISKYSREELVGRTHQIINSGYHSKEFFQELWQTIASGNVWQGEIKNKAKDGSFYWDRTTIVPFLTEEGKPYQYVTIQTDITEQKKLNELKNEFVSIVSHELRTPLTTILGFMEILLKRDLSMEKIKLYVDTVYKEATRLSDLINDFLDLQRMEAGRHDYHFTPVDVTELIKELAQQWEGKSKHRIMTFLPTDKIHVRADANRLRQVLHNLISNAVKYSPDADQIDLHVLTEGETVVINIQDYGLGIPEEAKKNLFTKFYRVDNSDRRKIGGTGLGLAIVKEIVEAHEGTITFESTLGKGSIFSINLANHVSQPMEGKVVIVEDDENLSQFIQDTLDRAGLSTVCYRSAEAAILALHNIKDNGAPPRLCIVDIVLEGSQTGWDFIAELYRHPIYFETPVIVSTVMEPPRQYREKETEKFLQKPFSIEKLNQVVKQMLELKDQRVAYIFPIQDEQSLTFSLKKNGIEISNMQVDEETIKVEVKKHVAGSTGNHGFQNG